MSDLSPLEEHFPRLVHEIVAFWGSPTCVDQLQGLLVDSRGGRQGFPPDAWERVVHFEMIKMGILGNDLLQQLSQRRNVPLVVADAVDKLSFCFFGGHFEGLIE